MHISDGILAGPTLAAGFIGTGILAALTLRNVDLEEIPKISVVTSAFFVASLIHIPIGISSIHLILNGLAGIILGIRAFPAIMLAVILQAILFGHGGITVIGINCLMLGGGALAAYGMWRLRQYVPFQKKEFIFAALAGATGTIVSGFILSTALATTGEAFWVTAKILFAYHIPIMFIEGAVAGACASFLQRVKPALLAGGNSVKPISLGSKN